MHDKIHIHDKIPDTWYSTWGKTPICLFTHMCHTNAQAHAMRCDANTISCNPPGSLVPHGV